MKLLVFDIWGEYGHYKKIYATSSAPSYHIPPKTSLYGYIGAVLGLQSDTYLEGFQHTCRIGIQPLSPITSSRIEINMRPNTKGVSENVSQVVHEVLVNPKYRIFLSHTDAGLMESLKQRLAMRKPYYTPCMGLSNFKSDFEFIAEIEADGRLVDGYSEIHSAIPKDSILGIKWQPFSQIVESDATPCEMSPDRKPQKYIDLVFDRGASPIRANADCEVFEFEKKNFVVF